MTKSSSRKSSIPKGNKLPNNVGVIPFYTKEAFPNLEKNSSDEEDGEVKKADTTSIPVKIDRAGGESKTNLTKFEVPRIRHFDNNVENVLKGFNLIDTKVMNHLVGISREEMIHRRMNYIEMICFDNAQQEYEEAIKYAKKETLAYYSTELIAAQNVDNRDCSMFELTDAEQAELVSNNTAFLTWINKAADLIHANEIAYMGYVSGAKTRLMKWKIFDSHFRNHLNVIIFGKKYHKAREEQKEYMQYGMTKPFGAKVAQCFRRVDMLANLMNYFPPTCNRDEMPEIEAWEMAMYGNEVSDMMNRKMKFNLLPTKFQNTLEEDTEEDWRVMVYPKFVALVQQCEAKDERERVEMAKNREKLKASALKRKDDGGEGLDRSSKSKNQAHKRFKKEHSKSGKGEASFCALCKNAGAPKWLYKNHNTADCNKADEYKRKLSGGAASQYNAKRDYKKELRKAEQMLKKFKKETRELKTMMKKKRKKSADDMSIDSASSVDTDTSY